MISRFGQRQYQGRHGIDGQGGLIQNPQPSGQPSGVASAAPALVRASLDAVLARRLGPVERRVCGRDEIVGVGSIHG